MSVDENRKMSVSDRRVGRRWQRFWEPRRFAARRDTGRAMSQENIEVVRRIARAFNKGDVDAIVAELDPNVEWEEQPIPGIDPVYHGHEGVRRWAEAIMGRELGALQVHVAGFTEAGDAVIASTRRWGAGQSSGVEVRCTCS